MSVGNTTEARHRYIVKHRLRNVPANAIAFAIGASPATVRWTLRQYGWHLPSSQPGRYRYLLLHDSAARLGLTDAALTRIGAVWHRRGWLSPEDGESRREDVEPNRAPRTVKGTAATEETLSLALPPGGCSACGRPWPNWCLCVE